MFTITLNDGSGEASVHTIPKTSIMVGRAPGNDLCLEKVKGVSRYHARIFVDGEKVLIQDLNSTNGTYLNKVKVEQATVQPKDSIYIGDAIIRVSFDASQVEAPDVLDEVLETEKLLEEPPAEEPTTITDDVAPSLQQDLFWTSLSNFLHPIWPYILDESVREICINGPKEIYVDTGTELRQTEKAFTEAELKAAVQCIVQYQGTKLTGDEATLDARFPDGSRVSIVFPPFSARGIALHIKKTSKFAVTTDRWLGFGSLTREMMTFLSACVQLRRTMLITGGAGVGKTSLLNVLGTCIPATERVLLLEDVRELALPQAGVVSFVARPPEFAVARRGIQAALLESALRMRPDRLVVGEVSSSVAHSLLYGAQAGTLTSLTSRSPLQALRKLESMLAIGPDRLRARATVADAVELVVHISRFSDSSRKVTSISEVRGLTPEGEYHLVDIFRFVAKGTEHGKVKGDFVWTGQKPECLSEMKALGLHDAVQLF